MQEEIKILDLPKRPKGPYSQSHFRDVQIVANFYPVTIKPIKQIHIFKIKLTPPIMSDDRTARTRILETALPDIKLNIVDPIFSGFSIYSVTAPKEQQMKIQVGDHEVNIKQVKVYDVHENPKLLLQFLNNGLRNLMSKLDYIEIGRTGKYFNAKKKDKIQNLMMYSGYKANFMELDKGIYLRVDTAKKIVRDQTVLDAINQIYKLHSDKDRDQKRNILQNQLINKIIMTNYGKTRYMKIIDIEYKDIQTQYIEGQNITILEYYQKRYSIKIQNVRQPQLVVEGNKRQSKVVMIPELCLMTGIPDDFDEFRRKKISEATIKSASQRKSQITQLMSEIKHTSEVYSLKEMGINIEKNMEKINAKIIPPPRITLGENQSIESGKQSFFNLFAQPIYSNKHSLKAAVIYFRSSDAGEIISIFNDTSRRLRIDFRATKMCCGDMDSKKAVSIIDECVYRAAEKQNCNICLILIPNSLKGQYKQIKQKCLLRNKIVCQVATEGTLKRKNFKSIATKILLQMIAKRGNTLWVPEPGKKIEKVMLVGFDSSKINRQTGKSMLAGVATINSIYSSICSKIQEYDDSNNKLHCMINILFKLMDAYISRNKCPPSEIIIFGNSISTDQIKLYQEFFISPVLEKLNAMSQGKKPSLTLVLINTKTSERFFESQGQSSVKNVPAGTIISEKVVSKNYDFFMVSQFATRGCTVPNHYRVIYSDSNLEQGIIQELIYSQCFNYVNWTGSIKIPGVLQYAKKCVKFNTQVLDKERLVQELENKLYFI